MPIALSAAAVLWFVMFSTWTASRVNFWLTMAVASLVLLLFARPWKGKVEGAATPSGIGKFWRQLLLGLGLALFMWMIFWVGNYLSSAWFDFARPQVELVYAIREEAPAWLIALQLLLLTGPAEELFWRGYIQRNLSQRWNGGTAYLVTLSLYTAVHVWSFNFMLIMSALVCGAVWGVLYWWRPHCLPALVIAHAVWDTCVFVVFPI